MEILANIVTIYFVIVIIIVLTLFLIYACLMIINDIKMELKNSRNGE